MSQESWLVWVNRAYFTAGGLAALATLAVVILGVAQYRLSAAISGRKDREFSEFRVASEAQVADLQRLTAEANQRTEQERIARLQMEAKFAWRTIAPNVAERIAAALPSSPGIVKLAYIANDPESLFLAEQVSRVLKTAKWDFFPEAETYYQRSYFGVIITGSSPAVVETRKAFDRAGLQVAATDVAPPDMAFGPQGLPPPVVTILIGSKAPPF